MIETYVTQSWGSECIRLVKLYFSSLVWHKKHTNSLINQFNAHNSLPPTIVQAVPCSSPDNNT